MRFRTGASILAAAGLLLAAGGVASAQTSTTGAVRGLVRDQANGETVIGATVVASGPALQGTQATITDDSGEYFVANLPPGIYQVVVYYADAQFSRTNVLIQLGKVAVVNININTQAAAGETIVIEGRAPLIDQQSTKTGSTITRDYTDNVPTGRTFGAVLGAAGGSQTDLYGTSVGGSTSVENTYIVEGVNTTDPGYGLLSTNLPNEFIQETEVITGGYNAEYGRSTGGIINVVSKSGGNELHGSAFELSAMISSMLIPLARKSRMSETQMRVPRMQGLPKQTFGSTEIRCKSGFIALPLFKGKNRKDYRKLRRPHCSQQGIVLRLASTRPFVPRYLMVRR